MLTSCGTSEARKRGSEGDNYLNYIVIILLLLADIFGAGLAWRLAHNLRMESGYFENPIPIEMLGPLIWLALYWVILFILQGMYRLQIALSRFDEIARCFKAVFIGSFIIYIATMDISDPISSGSMLLFYYSFLTFIFISSGRVGVRVLQRILRRRGIGLWNAIIVGYNEVGRKLHKQLHYFPVWGFNVVGFADGNVNHGEYLGKKVLGGITDLPRIIESEHVQFVLVAPDFVPQDVNIQRSYDSLMKVFGSCKFLRVRFMIVANFYQMVVGLVRTVEIHGLPLVEVMPQLVPISVRLTKRITDIIIGCAVSVFLVMIYPLMALLIKLDSPGPVFYVQKRIGRWGREFKVIKFRSMYKDAEKQSGAVWAQKDDPRVTRIGRLLRNNHLDEFPQFFNVLMGQMSMVGPRPERREFVEQFRTQIPLYERRLRIRPGITGWAQVRYKYDETLEDVIDKTKYDLFYIDHISLALDLKIIIATVLKMLSGGGR